MTKMRSTLSMALVTTAFAASTIVVTNVFAAEAWFVSRIKYVYPLADGSFILAPVDNSPSCTNPGTPKYHYAIVGQNGMSADGIKKLYSAALAAAAQGLVVNVAFDDATSNCYINRLAVVYE